MSMRKMIVTFAAALLLAPGAVFTADVPGVTDKEITIGISTPLSGPAALWGVTALGTKAWADYINDQGGVHGRKINLILNIILVREMKLVQAKQMVVGIIVNLEE